MRKWLPVLMLIPLVAAIVLAGCGGGMEGYSTSGDAICEMERHVAEHRAAMDGARTMEDVAAAEEAYRVRGAGCAGRLRRDAMEHCPMCSGGHERNAEREIETHQALVAGAPGMDEVRGEEERHRGAMAEHFAAMRSKTGGSKTGDTECSAHR
jgi:hypothetical protein